MSFTVFHPLHILWTSPKLTQCVDLDFLSLYFTLPKGVHCPVSMCHSNKAAFLLNRCQLDVANNNALTSISPLLASHSTLTFSFAAGLHIFSTVIHSSTTIPSNCLCPYAYSSCQMIQQLILTRQVCISLIFLVSSSLACAALKLL